MITLSEKTYLANQISRYWPELDSKSYEIASAFTRPQRGLFLNLIFKRELEKALEIIDNVKNLQAHI
jgi:hypothetical protein